jgi:hypothetical protein
MPEEKKSIQFVAVENIKFDLKNPRLPTNVAEQDSQEVILEWLVQQEKVVELMIAIGEQDYFPGEPLLVVKESSESEDFVVVEGNRRLAAVKLLSKPELAPTRQRAVQRAAEDAEHKPAELPVLEFNTRDEILKYLGYRHVTGVETWDTLAKARYLEQLYGWTDEEDRDERFKALARQIGSRSDYVQRLLAGLAIYRQLESAISMGLRAWMKKRLASRCSQPHSTTQT